MHDVAGQRLVYITTSASEEKCLQEKEGLAVPQARLYVLLTGLSQRSLSPAHVDNTHLGQLGLDDETEEHKDEERAGDGGRDDGLAVHIVWHGRVDTGRARIII